MRPARWRWCTDPECRLCQTGGGWIDFSGRRLRARREPVRPGHLRLRLQVSQGCASAHGTTEFQFDVAGFGFDSDTYEWLVVSQGGTNAQFKGSGTVNGGSGPERQRVQVHDVCAGDSSTGHLPHPHLVGSGRRVEDRRV